VGFVVDKVAPGQVFSEYFGFPCHSLHQIIHPHNHPVQVQQAKIKMADVPSGPSLDSTPTTQIKKSVDW
jgi:hypothetical protein